MVRMVIRNLIFCFVFLKCISGWSQSPESIALKLCRNFEERSSFELTHRVTNGIQEGVLVMYLPQKSKVITAETIVTISKLGGNYLNLAANDGTVKVWRDDELLFQGVTTTRNGPLSTGDGYFKCEYQAALPPFQGDYKVRIEYSPNSTKSTIFLWITDEEGKVQRDLEFRSNWDFTEPQLYRYVNDVPSSSPNLTWDFPVEVLSTQFESDESINDWTSSNGLMLEAMWRASQHFPEVDFTDFVVKHLDFFVNQIAGLDKEKYSTVKPPLYQYFRYQGLEDFALQSLPFFNDTTGTYKSFTSKALNKVLYKSVRSPDGVLARLAPDSLTIWAEDLYAGGLLLCRAYKASRSRKYLEEAVKQVILVDRKLKDRYSGLYWHGYSLALGEPSSSKFARANALILLAKAELLSALPESYPEREAILKTFRDQSEAVLEYQSIDGRWHQVLDNEDTYLETSATAMFVAAFADGINNNWLYNKEKFKKVAISGWLSVVNQVDENGNLDGVSPWASILNSDQEYQNMKPKINESTGFGAVILAAIAMDKLQVH